MLLPSVSVILCSLYTTLLTVKGSLHFCIKLHISLNMLFHRLGFQWNECKKAGVLSIAVVFSQNLEKFPHSFQTLKVLKLNRKVDLVSIDFIIIDTMLTLRITSLS